MDGLSTQLEIYNSRRELGGLGMAACRHQLGQGRQQALQLLSATVAPLAAVLVLHIYPLHAASSSIMHAAVTSRYINR